MEFEITTSSLSGVLLAMVVIISFCFIRMIVDIRKERRDGSK